MEIGRLIEEEVEENEIQLVRSLFIRNFAVRDESSNMTFARTCLSCLQNFKLSSTALHTQELAAQALRVLAQYSNEFLHHCRKNPPESLFQAACKLHEEAILVGQR